MCRTHETLHPRKLFLDKYEGTFARPIHTYNKDPVLTNLLDVFHDEGSDEVHSFILSHSVNGSTEAGQRTDTHDDVDDGMVVDSGPSMAENCSCQLFRHFPHLAHVLVINVLVEFWDKFGSEKGAVWQGGFLDTTRFGPDVVLSALCCHADGLAKLLIVEKAHGKTSRHREMEMTFSLVSSIFRGHVRLFFLSKKK
jgi:hypothetical protein